MKEPAIDLTILANPVWSGLRVNLSAGLFELFGLREKARSSYLLSEADDRDVDGLFLW
jgi:hypothetical protein